MAAAVVAGPGERAGTRCLTDAVLPGLVLWTGFPPVLPAGPAVREDVPWRLAAVHAGDRPVKPAAVATVTVTGVWR